MAYQINTDRAQLYALITATAVFYTAPRSGADTVSGRTALLIAGGEAWQDASPDATQTLVAITLSTLIRAAQSNKTNAVSLTIAANRLNIACAALHWFCEKGHNRDASNADIRAMLDGTDFGLEPVTPADSAAISALLDLIVDQASRLQIAA